MCNGVAALDHLDAGWQVARHRSSGHDSHLVRSSDFENWSLALLEGMATGLPILGVPNGGIPQLLSKVDPTLVPGSDDPAEIASGVRRLFEDPERRELLGRRARLVVADRL